MTEQRVVRVFVSSTFRDMHAERDELIKRTFPRLRKLCEERGVTWSEVDLRWGITEEQSERGEVLPVCLAEIHRCRPYFIGLLGERYGWVPDQIPGELRDQEPWLKEHLHHSVTELEILHGVLNYPKMHAQAFFYFRDPAFVDSLPLDQKADFLELPAKAEIERFGSEEAGRRVAERKHKLAALKARIKASRLPVRENYPNAQALGELVLRDLTEVIERLYPKGSEPNPLDREALDHQAFAQSRASVYIGRQSYYHQLEQHARGDGPPLVVLGESGSGKSALLSNWALQYRSEHPDELLVTHFIGSTPHSADWAAMLRRLMGELKRTLRIRKEIPDQPDALRAAFADWLHLAASKGRVVLILDALNQLEDRDSALDLVWLPPVIPSKVRLILSTLPGRPLDELTRRNWPTMKVEPLEFGERERLIPAYLAQYAKELSPARVQRIASHNQTASPLYLRALLDELRVFGIHEKLDARINYYLAARTADKLYQKILARYEEDYERERPGLVRDAVSLLWAARRGLSEAELLELLGARDQPLPHAHWSPLYLAAEQSLVSRSGLIAFSHDSIRQAVRSKYLRTIRQQQRAHLKLAGYFKGQPGVGARKIDELPWHLAEAGDWQQLYDLITEPKFFSAAWHANHFEVNAYWARIEANSPLRMVDAYRAWATAPEEDIRAARAEASFLLNDAGHTEQATSLMERFVGGAKDVADSAGIPFPPQLQAEILYGKGETAEAMRLLKEQERIFRRLGNDVGLESCLSDQAVILLGWDELDEAMQVSKEQERLCRELGKKDGLQISLGNQAKILRARGELDDAMQLAKEQEGICRESGNKDGLQRSFSNQADILRASGDLDLAIRLYKEQETICREFGYTKWLGASLSKQATILHQLGALDEALRLFREGELILGNVGDKKGLALSLGNQAMILLARGELNEALRLYKEEERICRELGDDDGLQRSLGNQAVILHGTDQLGEALLLCKEQEHICRELGNKQGLQQSLGNQAVLLRARDQLDEASQLYEEQERICREINHKQGLAYALINKASLLANERGRPSQALPFAEEAYDLAVKNNLVLVAEQIQPVLDFVRARIEEPPAAPVYVPSPHPAANAERAAQLNSKYQQELARWNSLPWWKRLKAKKPDPPTGI